MTAVVPSLLVVSESRITRRVVEMTFADQQVQVSSASTGDEALQSWRARPASVVIADVAMEAPNGYAIAREVRAHQEGRRTAVILLAAQTDVVDEVAISRDRVSSVLRKPLDSHLLVEAVREAVRLGPPASRAAASTPAPAAAPVPAPPAPPVQASPVPSDDAQAFVAQAAAPTLPAPAVAGQTPPQRTNPIENAQAEADDVALLLGQDSSGLEDLPAAEPVGVSTVAAVVDVPAQPLAETFHALLAVEEGGSPEPMAPAVGPGIDMDAVAARVAAQWSAEPGRHAELEAAIVARVADAAAASLGPAGERLLAAIAPGIVERVARELLPRVLEDVTRRLVGEAAERHVRDEIARMRAGRGTPS